MSLVISGFHVALVLLSPELQEWGAVAMPENFHERFFMCHQAAQLNGIERCQMKNLEM